MLTAFQKNAEPPKSPIAGARTMSHADLPLSSDDLLSVTSMTSTASSSSAPSARSPVLGGDAFVVAPVPVHASYPFSLAHSDMQLPLAPSAECDERTFIQLVRTSESVANAVLEE